MLKKDTNPWKRLVSEKNEKIWINNSIENQA